MDIFRTIDGQVTKVVHDDKTETAIKANRSMDGHVGRDGRVDTTEQDRGKYSVVISNSLGCRMRCQFCHLTMKGARYSRIGFDRICDNVIEAVEIAATRDLSLADRYVKLCWMGMGEDAIARPGELVDITVRIASTLIERGLAIGIDGVDLGTVMPRRVGAGWDEWFGWLDRRLDDFPANPQMATRADGRSRFRLFYSLHSATQQTRDRLIPGAMPLDNSLPRLVRFADDNGINLVFHMLLWSGINDTDEELSQLERIIDQYGLAHHELRLLRFNDCTLSSLQESPRFEEVAARMARIMPVKVQRSPGNEVKAACGQFIVREFDPRLRERSELLAITDVAAATAEIMRHRQNDE